MTFSNPIVGGTVLIRPAIKSPDYVAGTAGWSINKDGTAEFNEVTVRGDVLVGSGDNYVAIDPTPVPNIEISTSHTDQITPASIGFDATGGNEFFINGPDMGSGEDALMFQASSAGNIAALDFNDRLELQRVDQATRILMDTDIDVVGDTTFLNDVEVQGVLTAANRIAGTTSITPSAANTPTSKAIVFPSALTGSSFACQVTANTSVPGTTVTGVGYTALTSTGVTLWLTRTNTTATTLSYTVEGF